MGNKNFTPTRGFLIFAGIVIAGIVVFNVYQGLTVQKIGFLGLNLEFGETGGAGLASAENAPQTSPEERQNRQDELEQKIAQLEARLSESVQAGAAPSQDTAPLPSEPSSPGLPAEFEPESSGFNLTGTWFSDDGASYVVTQEDNFVTMQEYSPGVGLTAIAEGAISGSELDMTYETVFGTVGEGLLTISADGRSMTGTFQDFTTGVTIPATIRR